MRFAKSLSYQDTGPHNEFKGLNIFVRTVVGAPRSISGSKSFAAGLRPANLPQSICQRIHIIVERPGDEPSRLSNAIITQRPIELIAEPHLMTWLVTRLYSSNSQPVLIPSRGLRRNSRRRSVPSFADDCPGRASNIPFEGRKSVFRGRLPICHLATILR